MQSGSGMNVRHEGESGRPQVITVLDMVEAVRMPCDIIGRSDRTVSRPAPISDSAPECVSFYSKSAENASCVIGASRAGVILCAPESAVAVGACDDRTMLLVSNPRLAFIRVMNAFFAPEKPVGIHPTAVIHPEAELGERVYIGPFCYIGKASIGADTVIDGHAYIYDGVRVGKRCVVQANAVVGSKGFGLERNEVGAFEALPHLGGVDVGDDVLISSGVVIARGTFGDTVIGAGTKIDPLTQISHNVVVGRDCGICASVVIAGSVEIGERAWISFCASVRNGISIGAGATVGMGAVVTRDVPPGTTVYGVPARERQSVS